MGLRAATSRWRVVRGSGSRRTRHLRGWRTSRAPSSPRVLAQDPVDVERVQLPRAKAVDAVAGTRYQLTQLGLVVGRHRLTGGLPI